MPEDLTTCPDCGQHNILPRGLAAHRKSQHCARARAAQPEREPLTLARLDALPPVASQSVALKDLTVPQLGEAFRGLDAAQENYSKLSGICATMKGLVLTEVKAKVGHGNFIPWLAKHFPRHRARAAKHMRLAEEFGKCSASATFEVLTHDLAATLEAATNHQLDLGNPLVARVAAWVGNRSAYQLELELEPARRGGDTTPKDGSPPCRMTKADTAQAHFRALQELLFRGISPASIALLPHLPAMTDEPDKVASLMHLIEFTGTLKTALQDALKIVKGRI